MHNHLMCVRHVLVGHLLVAWTGLGCWLQVSYSQHIDVQSNYLPNPGSSHLPPAQQGT